MREHGAQFEEPVPEPSYQISIPSLLKRHELRMEFFDRGCVVKIGCKSIAFASVEEAMIELSAYVSNPQNAYDRWKEALKLD